MILVIDNYDSFTYNLVQYLLEAGAEVLVRKNDEVSLSEIEALAPAGLVVSPGPGQPKDAGVSMEVIRTFAGRFPILGVCLGHQAMAECFGARVVRAGRLMHGRTSQIFHGGEGVLAGLPSPLEATRYHSLIVDRDSLPEVLVPTAWTADGELMGLRHRTLDLEGVQFHPESFLTEHGRAMVRAFVGRTPAFAGRA
jgi:anthranilate synthase/aminodeoxychorismate synthase-like glutamine amidotransferase